MTYSQEEVEAAIIRFRETFVEAERRNSWSWIADELYHEDATYYCPYGGVMELPRVPGGNPHNPLWPRHGYGIRLERLELSHHRFRCERRSHF